MLKVTPHIVRSRKRLLVCIGEVYNLVQSGFEGCDELNQE
jgi:hypothetical protein